MFLQPPFGIPPVGGPRKPKPPNPFPSHCAASGKNRHPVNPVDGGFLTCYVAQPPDIAGTKSIGGNELISIDSKNFRRAGADTPSDRPLVLVTGATGFIGKRLCQCLIDSGQPLRQAVRSTPPALASGEGIVQIGDIGPQTDWAAALQSVDAVVHLAAHVHQMASSEETDSRYFEVNTLGTERLATAAAKAGVKRFVYLSSIKVNGEQTAANAQFTEEQTPHPLDPYGVSKGEAEQRLRSLAATSGMEVVIIRPPLVYGPGVTANFARLIRLVGNGLPLPLASVRNRRSLVFLDNLVDFIVCSLHHPAAAGQTFLISDGEDLSTPDLIRKLAGAMGRSARLWPCPLSLLRLAGKLSGRSAVIDRLSDSLRVDSSKAQKVLGWQPPYTVAQGIQKTVDWYLHPHEHNN